MVEVPSWGNALMWGFALLASFLTPAAGLYDIDVRRIAELWEREHISPHDPSSLRHPELLQRLRTLESSFPSVLRVESVGRSSENREIDLVSVGSGPKRILLWSQMHGDEPTATSTLLDLFYFFGKHAGEGWVREILRNYTLLCIPMLNPDGAEHLQRRNAQGIDINRDARLLQTPEGRVLKTIRDRFHPFLGFNLHDQSALTTVGTTGKVATIALLAVASGKAGAGGDLARKVSAVLYDALSPFIAGHISRYNEEFNPRAFGDNLTLWGTPVVLIECGGLPAGQPPGLTVKLNFVGLLAVLNSLSTGRIGGANPGVYDSMKRNSDIPIYDLILRDGRIFTGTGVPPFRGDVAIRKDSRADRAGTAIIADLGDLGVFPAHATVDCKGSLVSPGLIGWEPDQSFFSPVSSDHDYLRRGFTSILETASTEDLSRLSSPISELLSRKRAVNWGLLVSGNHDGTASAEMKIIEWLAAGGRGWVVESEGMTAALKRRTEEIAGWFGVEALTRERAGRFEIPKAMEGDPATVLPRWCGEAARQFRLSGRGVIAQGAVADLVVWSTAGRPESSDIRDYRPSRIILNGQLFDPNATELKGGRFLGRPGP